LQPDWNHFGRWIGGLAALSLALGAAVSVAGAEPEAQAASPPPVELDRLLKLPSNVEVPVGREQIGSASKNQWRARFESARAEHSAAEAALEASQKKLGTAAENTAAWQIAPPGAGVAAAPSEAPVDFQLKQEMRRQREDLLRSEKHLRELTIEADLAGVPADWRE
jgi:hypothetical protein